MLEIMKKGYAAIFIIAMLSASVLTEDMLNTQYMAVLWSAFSSANAVTGRTMPVTAAGHSSR